MYPKFFFERFWESEQKNELFVCMPFHDSLDNKFNKIDDAAKKAGFDKATRVKEDLISDVITDKIFYGIANSKMILFDLSDDPNLACKQASINVLYELGIANAIREPQDILLVKEKSSNKPPFDISGMRINYHEGALKIGWLANMLKFFLDEQKWYKSKRVKAAAESIDNIGLFLMSTHGKNPVGYNHFNTENSPPEIKMSVLRLLDLGIIRFATGGKERPTEYAYHWTPFGYEVIKCLEIKRTPLDKFKKSQDYKDFMKGVERWKKLFRIK